ncbi:MAG: hypothetical protein JWM27_1054 [Gemmatimonadetes bacterium]|nr:hypothetical protein [Gemmatimonadota bacterium]
MDDPTGGRHYFADRELARRLEGAEAAANTEFVDAHARVDPASGATWTQVAGARAMYDGPGSPVTQTFGLGLFDDVGDAEMDALEAFFGERGAEVFHEVSPMAAPEIVALLNRRRYQPFELTSVLYRPIAPGVAVEGLRGERIRVRRMEPGEEDAWAATAAGGWSDVAPEHTGFMTALGRINAARRDTRCFFAELDGRAVATGSLNVHDGVALLAGASTLPGARGHGAQLALLEARLRDAVESGCDLASMGALPGSTCQRNAERQGFRIAYTRMKWQRAPTA